MKHKMHTDFYLCKRIDSTGKKYAIEKEVPVYNHSRIKSDTRLWFYVKGKRGCYRK